MQIKAVAIDETKHWNLGDLAQHVLRIETVFVYDATAAVYCCELTPSFELWPVETRAILADDVDEETRDTIDDIMMTNASHDVEYHHVRTIDKLASVPVTRAADCEDMPAVVDECRSNAVL